MAEKKGYKVYQPNKKDLACKRSDCVIRALCKATGKEWLEVFDGLVAVARELQAIPNEPVAYEKYLAAMGYKWVGLKAEKGKKRLTPETFCRKYKTGTYILRVSNHLVTAVDGCYYDTWDCGNKGVYGYWVKEV